MVILKPKKLGFDRLYPKFWNVYVLALQTHHVYSTFKRHGNDHFHVVSTWITRDMFVRWFNLLVPVVNWKVISSKESAAEKGLIVWNTHYHLLETQDGILWKQLGLIA